MLYTQNNTLNFKTVIGWILFSIAFVQIPLWWIIAVVKKRNHSFPEVSLEKNILIIIIPDYYYIQRNTLFVAQIFRRALDPSKKWGPKNHEIRKQWKLFKKSKE